MTLEELQAEFPHGSRWRHVRDYSETLTVVGWNPDSNPDYPVITTPEGRGGTISRCVEAFRPGYGMGTDGWERIPDPVPCPITEPTTLAAGVEALPNGLRRTNSKLYGVTLHPAEPGATEGRYTWDGAA